MSIGQTESFGADQASTIGLGDLDWSGFAIASLQNACDFIALQVLLRRKQMKPETLHMLPAENHVRPAMKHMPGGEKHVWTAGNHVIFAKKHVNFGENHMLSGEFHMQIGDCLAKNDSQHIFILTELVINTIVQP